MLQSLIGAHPLVATSQETELFKNFVVPLVDAWQKQLDASDEDTRRVKGLPTVLTQAEFDAAVAEMIEVVHSATLRLKPGSTIVVDKTPSNTLHVERILRYLPTAQFVHVVRDGRDVSASLLRAARSWGSNWAPTDPRKAARTWRTYTEAALAIPSLPAPYLEVRYEQLASESGPHVLAEILEFCGLPVAAGDCEAMFDRVVGGAASSMVWGGEVMRRRSAPPEEPAGFAGGGGVGAWRKDLSLVERVAVDVEAGDLLRSLGYADSSRWIAGTSWQRTAAVARFNGRRAVASARRRLYG